MNKQRDLSSASLILALGLSVLGMPAQGAEKNAKPMRIGMVESLFRGMQEPLIKASMTPFRALVELQTGIKGEMVRSGDAFALGQDLAANKIQLGVFHGFEYGWARTKYPKLRPLLIAINQERLFHAHVVVKQTSTARSLEGLQGKSIALPPRSWEHCFLYLERACAKNGKKIDAYFSRVVPSETMEDALDDVVDGTAEATVVDSVSLGRYRSRKPGRSARLKDIQRSALFPAAVVVYRPGSLDEATLSRFQRGMLNAHENAFGRQMLTLWRLTKFEKVPDHFEQDVLAIIEKYPPKSTAQSHKAKN